MDGGEWAIVGGGGATALGAILGVVKRYVDPRLDALIARVDKLEALGKSLDDRIDDVIAESSKDRATQREVLGGKVKETHDRIDAIKQTVGDLRAEVGYLRGKTTTRAE